jgi:hypothetical protein
MAVEAEVDGEHRPASAQRSPRRRLQVTAPAQWRSSPILFMRANGMFGVPNVPFARR